MQTWFPSPEPAAWTRVARKANCFRLGVAVRSRPRFTCASDQGRQMLRIRMYLCNIVTIQAERKDQDGQAACGLL